MPTMPSVKTCRFSALCFNFKMQIKCVCGAVCEAVAVCVCGCVCGCARVCGCVCGCVRVLLCVWLCACVWPCVWLCVWLWLCACVVVMPKRGPDWNCFWKCIVILTVSVQRASQPFASWVVLHSEDLHTLSLSYTEVQLSSSMPVMPDSGCMENLHLPLQLWKDRNKVVKMNTKQKLMRFRWGWSGCIKKTSVF